MAVTPPISNFFGLDPRFMASPAASSGLINPLLFGSSFQMVPINFGPFSPGIPPIFGGSGFTGFQTIPFNIFAEPVAMASPFGAGNAFGGGFGTPFGSNATAFSQQGVNTFANPFQQQQQFGGLQQQQALAQQQAFAQQQALAQQQAFAQQQSFGGFGGFVPQQQFGGFQQQQSFGFPQQQQFFGFPQQQQAFGFPQQQQSFGFNGFF